MRPDERREKIKEQAVAFQHDVAQLILHERAEHDRPHAFLLRGAIDLAHGLLCLVNARHKWQSHRPKFEAAELRQQAVTQVSAVTPVWSDTKKTVRRLTVSAYPMRAS